MNKILPILFSFLFLFNIGYSAEAAGTTITAVSPSDNADILIRDLTAIPFKFYFTSTVTNASCYFYMRDSTHPKDIYDYNCTIWNNTITTFYPNTTFTTQIYDNWEWIVNCSVGCHDWSNWKDMDAWHPFTVNSGIASNTMSDVGIGTGTLLTKLSGPLGDFILNMGIVGAVMGLIGAIVAMISNKLRFGRWI